MCSETQLSPFDDEPFGWALAHHRIHGDTHVVPTQDLKPHWSTDCWCDPELNDEGVLVHNSADGRERYENQRAKPH